MSVVSEREYEFTRADFEKIRALICALQTQRRRSAS